MTVRYLGGQYYVNESEGSLHVCLQLEGKISKEVVLTMTALDGTAKGI